MQWIDGLLLFSGVLILLGIASSKLSARLGVPVLVLFLTLGMLAGSDGIGGIPFDNYPLAYSIGTVALVLILFDGGLGTTLEAVREVWKPSLSLATLGVLLTSLIVGGAAMLVLGFHWLDALLLGSIVGSTDAAAVFGTLRMGGIALPQKLVSTLEIESGSNDPMAIFMTIGCVELITGQRELGWNLLGFFLSQMIVGTIVGIGIGTLAVRVVNRINLGAAGLYPVLVTAFCLLTFGLTVWLGGSGFLAVYLAGIVIGSRRLVFQRGIRLFHDAIAWLAQIIMFVVLGLLSEPARLLTVAGSGLIMGAVLIFLARPFAVLISLLPFRFHWRELTFISWGGLKGAVPITLATFPLLYGAPQALLIFDITFFVVVLSAVVQGWSLPLAARLLRLEIPSAPTPPVTLEISSLKSIDSDIVDYTVSDHSRAAGRMVKELALPGGVVIALISRSDEIIPPQGNTTIQPGDHVILVLRPETRSIVDRIFSHHDRHRHAMPEQIEFPLRPTTTVGELEDMYGFDMNLPGDWRLDQAVTSRIKTGDKLLGSLVNFGQLSLRVRAVSPLGTVESLTMLIAAQDEADEQKTDANQDDAVAKVLAEADEPLPLSPIARSANCESLTKQHPRNDVPARTDPSEASAAGED